MLRRLSPRRCQWRLLGVVTLLVVITSACSPAPDIETPSPDFRLTSEEAGFLAKGELFEIYGSEADPVVVQIETTPSTLDGQPVWQLDTTVDLVPDGTVQQRTWRFWVGLDDQGQPAVLAAEETT